MTEQQPGWRNVTDIITVAFRSYRREPVELFVRTCNRIDGCRLGQRRHLNVERGVRMNDMDKLLAARFFFVDPDRPPLEVKLGNGKFEAGAGSGNRIFRFELWNKGILLFWTHCCPDGSEAKVSGDTLTIEYVVRNALFAGIDYRGDSSVNDVASLAFRFVAKVGPDKSLVVSSLTVGKPVAGGFYQEFKGYEVWKDDAKTAKFRWALESDARSVPLFLAMGAQQVTVTKNIDHYIPVAIRRAKNPQSNQYRIEISLGLNNDTRLESVIWPEVETDGVLPVAGPRFRLSADARSARSLEYGVPLNFDTASKPSAYGLVQTDPWSPPTEKDRAVWREFRIERLSPYRLLEGFNASVSGPVRNAIAVSNEGDGISALPQIDPPVNDPDAAGAPPAATATIVWQQQDLNPGGRKWGNAEFGSARDVGIKTTGPFQVRVTFPGFASSQGPLGFHADCAFVDINKNDEGHKFGPDAVMTLTKSRGFDERDVDIGAMRLNSRSAELKTFRLAWGLAFDRQRPMLQRPAFHLDCALAKLEARPAGFDPVPSSRFSDDTNSALLQMPILGKVDRKKDDVQILGEHDREDDVQSVLDITEWGRDDRSRSLALTLSAQKRPPADGAVAQRPPVPLELIVLEPAPFFLAKVSLPMPLASADNPDGNLYASWSLNDAEGPQWRYRSSEPNATLTLPNQGVGEAYERRKDIDEPPTDVVRPAIEYRLGPHAVFTLRLRDDERAYSDLPWNFRQLFGQPGEVAPGPLLSSAKFELLYGLQTTLTPAGIRLTTDEVRRGRIAQRFDMDGSAEKLPRASDASPKYREAWDALVESYQSRLLSLHPYRPLADDALRFDQSSGLSQRLRLAKAGETHRNEFADLHPEPYLDKGDAGIDKGLRGGATFGFESKRIYDAVTRDLQSTSGELSRVAWTALGGYGALKARFDEDRSIIEANVELGRVSHYAVERIGRIGVFWNRAKHVIVYERTTQRADRYALGDEQQNELAFLPIVRKIDEYIEILEPERRFAPAGKPTQATGFVQGLKFADRIIRVSSLWGADVGEVGWSVPLWRRDGNAAVFPKPMVNLIAASEDAGEEALHAIADPEHLLFFTNTVRDTSGDTDRWPAVEGVDFVDAAVRLESTDTVFGDRSADTLRRPLSSPAESPSAIATCTWRIEDGERPINLIAGRGPQPISAKLRNLTVMRKPAALAGEATPTRRARSLLAEFDALRRDVRDTVRDGLMAGWGEARWKAEKGRLEEKIKALREALDADIDKLFGSSPCKLLTEQALRPLRALSQDVRNRIDEEGARIQRDALALQKMAESDIQRLAGEFLHRIDMLAASGDLAKAQIDETLLRIQSDLDLFQTQAVAAVEQSKVELQALLVDIGSGFDLSVHRLRIVRAQQIVSTTRQRLLPTLDDLERACAHFAARWEGKKEAKTLAERLRDLIRQARKALEDDALSKADAVLHAAAQAVTVAEKDLSDAINATSGHLKTACQHFVNTIVEVRKLLDDGVGQFKALSGEAFAAFSTAIKTLREAIVTVRGNLNDAIDAQTFVAAVDVAKTQLKSTIGTIYNQADKQISKFIEEKKICDFLPAVDAARIAALQKLLADVEKLVAAMGQGVLAAALKNFDGTWSEFSSALEDASDWVNHVTDSLGESVRTAINAPLSLLRAFGAAPNLPELSFNREWLEYVFDPSDLTIDISPVTSFFAELGDGLKGLSLNLPSVGLDASGLLPAALRDFDLNVVFGSLGGVKMPGLLSRVKLPNLDRNAVRVTHGFDKKTKRAWVQADVDVPYDTNPVLFDAMSLALRLVKPKFSARSRMDAGLEGKPAFYAKGEIASTIRLEFSGSPLVDLRDATIRFDDRGQFDFDFSPDRIDFKAGLKFLADLIRTRSEIDQNPEKARGFVPALIEADGVPIGVRTTLELDPGPLNFGAFSIDGLALNLSFELVAKPEFKVGTRLSLASPDKPFMLSVGLLGGGGWLAAAASYLPSKGLVESEVDISIAVGRVFAVNFGPVRGMAQVVFGVNAKFVSSGSRSRFSLIVFFLFSGNVRLWGIITVSLYLRLEIEYQSSGSLVGRGVVHVTVKIGRFFKRTVRQRVNYRFAGKEGGQKALTARAKADALPDAQPQPVDHGQRAAAYLDRYED